MATVGGAQIQIMVGHKLFSLPLRRDQVPTAVVAESD